MLPDYHDRRYDPATFRRDNREENMTCRRCKGMMVREWCTELYTGSVMKCVNCGAVVDALILRNQGVVAAADTASVRREPQLVA